MAGTDNLCEGKREVMASLINFSTFWSVGVTSYAVFSVVSRHHFGESDTKILPESALTSTEFFFLSTPVDTFQRAFCPSTINRLACVINELSNFTAELSKSDV
jgi:hypothetical protein